MKSSKNKSKLVKDSAKYIAIVILSFIVLQSLVIVMHEFTHSTMAWLLGFKNDPLNIVWGNFLTMSGWDEGVEYSKLFASGHNKPAAIIGICPLILHTLIIISSFIALKNQKIQKNKWVVHGIFWFMIANYMELFAYGNL